MPNPVQNMSEAPDKMQKQQSLRASHLNHAYHRRQVVKDVSFEVHPGEIVGLLGPNGAGKTTSFNLATGLLPLREGEVSLGVQQLGHLPLYKRALLGLGYLPQESTIFRGLSVEDNFLAILDATKEKSEQKNIKCETLIKQFNLEHVRKNMGSQLSGGERRRVEMARALINQPSILLLDEPFAGIDPIAVSDIRKLILKIQSEGIGILITDHNVRETLTICDRAYLISDGKILLTGTPEEIVSNAEARATYFGEDFVL
jgi:lipopolysaccharide export system ATP-binding protein